MATMQPKTTQLEFHQAMADFKTMFPEMDDDVIEAVLRSNQGAVDETIDQLLAMTTDNENEKLRHEFDTDTAPRETTTPKVFVEGDGSAAGLPLRIARGWDSSVFLRPIPDDFLRLPPECSFKPQTEGELEDERIAMLLQNEEFMAELRWNKEFLSTLDKEDPPKDRSTSFAGRLVEDDALFRERLRNMGKLSRKKFSQLARVFTGRKKRAAKSILHNQAPRDRMLLKEETDSDTY